MTTGWLPVCVNKSVSHSMCSSNRAHLLGRISISKAAIEADSSLASYLAGLCACLSECIHIGSDDSMFDVSLLIFPETLTIDRGDTAGVTWGCRFLAGFHTCTRGCAHVRSLENFTEQRASRFCFFLSSNPIISTKEIKKTISPSHVLTLNRTVTLSPCICYTLPSHSEKLFLKLTHAILLSNVRTLGFTRTHTQPQWQTCTQTHSSLFSDKGLVLQLCHDSTKDFFSRKRGLNRDLVGDWAKALTLFSFPLSLPPSLPPFLPLCLPLSLSHLSPVVEVQNLRAGSHFPPCFTAPL